MGIFLHAGPARQAARRAIAHNARMTVSNSRFPGLHASIQLLPSDVEAHFDDQEDRI